jgi:hypothetical protein
VAIVNPIVVGEGLEGVFVAGGGFFVWKVLVGGLGWSDWLEVFLMFPEKDWGEEVGCHCDGVEGW